MQARIRPLYLPVSIISAIYCAVSLFRFFTIQSPLDAELINQNFFLVALLGAYLLSAEKDYLYQSTLLKYALPLAAFLGLIASAISLFAAPK